jgi:hypothetical protein
MDMNEQGRLQLGSWPRQEALLRTILILATGASCLALLLFVILGVTPSGFPLPLTAVAGAFLLTAALSLALLRRGRYGWAVGIYIVGFTLVVFMAIYFANGAQGPITVVLVSIPVVAGLLGGRHAARNMVFLVVGIYLAMAALEGFGVLEPLRIVGLAERLIYHSVFVLAIAIITYLVMTSNQMTQGALLAEEERSDQLAQANLQLEMAAQAEVEARRREEGLVRHLRQSVARYSAYLGQVMDGNYQARLSLDAAEAAGANGEAVAPVEELVILGKQIEDTVQALLEALDNLQRVQRRYVQESWEEFAQGAIQRDYRYTQAASQELPAGLQDTWSASLAEAVREHRVTAAEEELALPITLRGELLGAIGLRREGQQGWSEVELALAETVGDQLAQTMESLRLLEDAQRRAARDRLMGEVMGRMRETLDLETVLKTTADELFRVLNLDEVTVRLVPDIGGGDEVRS